MEKDHDILLSEMVKNINDAVIATNAEGRIKLMNSLAESLTGWELNDAMGKELKDVFTPLKTAKKSLNDLYIKHKSLTDNVALTSKQGEELSVKCSLKIIKDNEDINGFILVFNNNC